MEKLKVSEAKFILGLLNEQMTRIVSWERGEISTQGMDGLQKQEQFERCAQIKDKIEKAIENSEITL